jgi:hypothetical protein
MSVILQQRQLYADRVDLYFEKVVTDPVTVKVNIYVSLSEFGTYYQVAGDIPNEAERGRSNPQVNFSIPLEQVTDAHASLALATFMATPLFFKGTTVDDMGVESLLVNSLPKAVGTVGVRRGSSGDNPARTANLSILSQTARGWVPGSGSSNGATAVSTIPFYEDEFVIERTFLSPGVIGTETIYLKSDLPGSRAMQIKYSNYSGTVAGKVEYLNTVKP